MPEIWIQLEDRVWDVSPFRFDRMTGQSVAAAAVPKVITSPETGVSRTRMMWKPLNQDALILRRYTPNWAAPDDRKVNPWDLNELDPTDNGTMGTIPGPVIECQLGETITVHFRNKDSRAGKPVEARTHSLHPHGFVFDPRYDGAFPLSPPDPSQPVGPEAAL
jgi:FtsP/CotA-like multicopper oxidase with cupredoxin domain